MSHGLTSPQPRPETEAPAQSGARLRLQALLPTFGPRASSADTYQKYDLYDDAGVHLPQGPPSPHHWALQNLTHLVHTIAHTQGFESATEYLSSARISHIDVRKILLYALAVTCAGNCWTIQRSSARFTSKKQLTPAPPPNLYLMSLDMQGQSVPCVLAFYRQTDGTGVLTFRGTSTMRENLIDASTIVSTFVDIPPKQKTGADEPPVPRFLKSFVNAYAQKDRRGRSMHDYVDKILRQQVAKEGPHSRLIITGHSLGGTFAQLAAYAASQTSLYVTLVTFASAAGASASFCSYMQALAPRVATYAVINTFDVVPKLQSLLTTAYHCCPLVPLRVAKSTKWIDRLYVHDILYYGYALLKFGTVSYAQEPKKTLCAKSAAYEEAERKTYVSVSPVEDLENFEAND